MIPDIVDTAARLHGQAEALRFGNVSMTYAELRARVAAMAATLAGFHQTGRIGVLSANRPGVVLAVHASARLGVPFVPHGYRLTAEELAWQVEQAHVTTLLFDDERANVAREIAERFGLRTVPLADVEDSVGPSAFDPAPPIDLEREAAVLFTSGTTGRPKGARLTYGNLWYSAVSSALLLGHNAEDVWVAALSLHHIGGLSILYRAAVGGVTADLHPRFEPHAVLNSIAAGASLVSLVPTMLQRVLEAARDNWVCPDTLRGVLLGGAAAPQSLVDRCLAAGVPVLPTYGLTESTAQAATLLHSEVRNHAGSSGRALPLTELRVRTNGRGSEPGEPGEIEVRGPAIFAGYLGESPRDPASWFATGDVGYLDADGYLSVIDRRTDLIVSGGENIYPAEIERALLTHPQVQDAAVVGVPDAQWGARPLAAVVWAGAPGLADAALRDHCRQAIATIKIPDRVVEVPEVPRSPGGKLLRREVRTLLGVGE